MRQTFSTDGSMTPLARHRPGRPGLHATKRWRGLRGVLAVFTAFCLTVMVGVIGNWQSATAPPADAAGAAAPDPWRHLAAATAQAELSRPAADADAVDASLEKWQAQLAAMLGPSPERAWQQALAWAARRPAWAQALVEPLLEPLWQRRMFEGMLQGLDETPGLEASLRGAWTDATVARWTDIAPTQAALWAAKRMAASAAAGAEAAAGESAAAESGSGPSDGTRPAAGGTHLLAVVNDRWANQDARSATVFASTLPPAIGRPLLTESLNRWLALDGSAARTWIRSQGASPALDASIAQHATQDELARQSPQEAVDLVHRIADPSLRQQAQWALARTFRDIDPTQEVWQTQALAGGAALPDEDTQAQASGSDSGLP
ncbi:hypothetical protein [Roseateles terrae]|uniref:DUF3106 domain-containing protein n=1 Tax=Roseateles terrae TaxID=431060 RepID=A0ABR6GNX8_9BURK|nr:hypothetical protein [Roseateles terrae]MBB3192959.1 hypothetical protein [Roseateles terrae]OWQ89790.1 hypothetical protein CDN98_04575 [Roseateles terrae]